MTLHNAGRTNRLRNLSTCLIAGLAAVLVLAPVQAYAAAPSNDNFADRALIADVPFTDSRDTTEATEEEGEPQPGCATIRRTVWYAFTPSTDAVLQADTFGSDFDTAIGIWTGDSLSNLTEVGCDDDTGDGLDSLAVFRASAGTTYLIQAGGYGGDAGALSLYVGPPTYGSISGTVTSDTGDPLPEICVEARSGSDERGGWAETTSSGAYTIGGLSDGIYHVRFYDWCDSQRRSHEAEWFDDQPSEATATGVPVTSPEAVTGIDAELTSSVLGSISGTVTSDSGEPLPDICVYVWDTVEDEALGWTETQADGSYSIGAPEGSYKVHFYDGCDGRRDHEGEWFDNATFTTATEVPVSPPQATTGIDAELTALGSISGTVTTDTGEPPSPVCVDVYDAETGDWTEWTETTPSGSYWVGVLEGSYHVTFYDCGGVTNYRREWFDDQPTRATASEVVVSGDGETAGIDAQLTTLGSISGTVTSETGELLSGVCVRIFDATSGEWMGGHYTTSSGTYRALVPNGTYHIQFEICSGPRDHEMEWFDDQPTEETATDVVVTGNLDISGIDAELTALGAITGTVTSEDTGELLSDVCIQVYDAATGGVTGAGRTDTSGSYIAYVPRGTHSVLFYDCWNTIDYLQEWFDDQPTQATANDVVVTNSADAVGIDAELAPSRSDPPAPETTITSGPSGIATDPTAIFGFAASEPGSTFECSLDGSSFGTCTSPTTYSGLAEGSHTFRVRAANYGQVDPTPAERTWIVDISAPVLSIDRPTAGAYVNNQSVGGTGPIVVVGFVTVEAKARDPHSGIPFVGFEVDGVPVTAPVIRQGDSFLFTYRPAFPGNHTITARATNQAGLTSATSISVVGIPAG